jgi:hypothetical protein
MRSSVSLATVATHQVFAPHAYGHPGRSNGNWTVQNGTGQFSGLTGGSGTDTLSTNGAQFEVTWSGTVTSQ